MKLSTSPDTYPTLGLEFEIVYKHFIEPQER